MRARAVSGVTSGVAILLSSCLVGLLLCVLAGSASAAPTPKNVVLLFSDLGQRANFLDVFETSLRSQGTTRTRYSQPLMRASRAASTRFSAPSLLIASDR